MTDVATRSPDAVLKQLPRLRELLGRYGLGYALALFLVCINLLVLTLAGPAFSTPFLFLIPGVLAAGVLGGWGPGLLATGLSLAFHLYAAGEYAGLLNPLLGNVCCRHLAGRYIRPSRDSNFMVWRAARSELLQALQSTRDAAAREAHVQSILDTVPEAMIVIDERGIIQSFSAAAERLFGYKRQEAIGKKSKR